MRRGDLVAVALPGDYGKPRPALIVQANLFGELPSVTVLPITSELRDVPATRISVAPTDTNCLQSVSQIMVDKIQSISKKKIGYAFGRLDDAALAKVDRALALFLGLA